MEKIQTGLTRSDDADVSLTIGGGKRPSNKDAADKVTLSVKQTKERSRFNRYRDDEDDEGNVKVKVYSDDYDRERRRRPIYFK